MQCIRLAQLVISSCYLCFPSIHGMEESSLIAKPSSVTLNCRSRQRVGRWSSSAEVSWPFLLHSLRSMKPIPDQMNIDASTSALTSGLLFLKDWESQSTSTCSMRWMFKSPCAYWQDPVGKRWSPCRHRQGSAWTAEQNCDVSIALIHPLKDCNSLLCSLWWKSLV